MLHNRCQQRKTVKWKWLDQTVYKLGRREKFPQVCASAKKSLRQFCPEGSKKIHESTITFAEIMFFPPLPSSLSLSFLGWWWLCVCVRVYCVSILHSKLAFTFSACVLQWPPPLPFSTLSSWATPPHIAPWHLANFPGVNVYVFHNGRFILTVGPCRNLWLFIYFLGGVALRRKLFSFFTPRAPTMGLPTVPNGPCGLAGSDQSKANCPGIMEVWLFVLRKSVFGVWQTEVLKLKLSVGCLSKEKKYLAPKVCVLLPAVLGVLHTDVFV